MGRYIITTVWSVIYMLVVGFIAEKRIPKMIPTITQFLKSVPLNEALRVKGPAIKPTTNM